ncbi:uncharacterized protein LOC125235430 [Leguminivora glycinivorella]|uniref:uncharacterized protein LOC125235430 n=1 Tax=Leguminivora glycinivorella TaxID=1035111 RepID=UPI00200CD104|nr:uncharacterized protein LOC125235430 [Leguminivora glycinivorella]
MPDSESKKNQQKKGKHDPKEQRKPRQQRNQGAGEKKSERRTEEPKVAIPEKPAFEEPGPEFYKGLKRETDDILKITEDANSKYKKKEIKSNWSKYEVPIESYDDIEEQENLGADYEKLIQAPMSLGGHFQFKHEKSWDITTGPSLYDKYFDITGNDLATALCTIPFYERNSIDKNIFSETDIQTMDHRTSRYKHKYFKIATTESEIQDKLINSLKEDFKESVESKFDENDKESEVDKKNEIIFEESKPTKTEPSSNQVEILFKSNQEQHKIEPIVKDNKECSEINDIDDIIVDSTKNLNLNKKLEVTKSNPAPEKVVNTAVPASAEPTKKPVIESPEDLEKWLDDFLEE